MRYKIIFSYDGTNYYGYQKQPDKKTIQEEIEKVLTKINSNNTVNLVASGRTDAGVHALGQTAHFDMNQALDKERLICSINKLIPDDIYVDCIEEVNNDFHARFSVTSKEYIYKINTGNYNPISKNYIYQYNKNINVKKIEEGLQTIIGTHDFKSFTKDPKEDTIRTIHEAKVQIDEKILTISLVGNGFMRYMVRNIVGTMIDYAEGKYTLSTLKDILESKDRTKAGKCAPACGLYLKTVNYD